MSYTSSRHKPNVPSNNDSCLKSSDCSADCSSVLKCLQVLMNSAILSFSYLAARILSIRSDISAVASPSAIWKWSLIFSTLAYIGLKGITASSQCTVYVSKSNFIFRSLSRSVPTNSGYSIALGIMLHRIDIVRSRYISGIVNVTSTASVICMTPLPVLNRLGIFKGVLGICLAKSAFIMHCVLPLSSSTRIISAGELDFVCVPVNTLQNTIGTTGTFIMVVAGFFLWSLRKLLIGKYLV